MNIEVKNNPVDHPAEWIRDETLSDVRLDGLLCTVAAVAIARNVFSDACQGYADAVRKQDPNLLAGDRPLFSHVATSLFSSRSGTPPQTVAVANGPGYSLALFFRDNRFQIADIAVCVG